MPDLHHTIDVYIAGLSRYALPQLQTKPTATSWSMGQLYLHLIYDSSFYLEQTKKALTTTEHSRDEMSLFARQLFEQNQFPDELIKGDPSNDLIPQPESRECLLDSMLQLKHEIVKLTAITKSRKSSGKSEHPGFQWLTAEEWLQLLDMHFRHHLRQKKRIDEFLESQFRQRLFIE